jgi:glycosyltransferase involved in cell wall biosynthesis
MNHQETHSAENSVLPREVVKPRVLVVIPAYNEESNITRVIDSIHRIVPGVDVLVVDDGSRDSTAYLARAAGAEVISLPFNLGYGVACQTGFKYARRYDYDYVVQMDADGQHEPRCILYLLAAVMDLTVDVALGSRWLGLTGYDGPLLRKFGKCFFGFLAHLLTRHEVTDPTTGFQALSKQVIDFYCTNVYPTDYPDADVIIMLDRAGFRVKEVPVVMYRDESGQSMHAGLLKPIYYGMKMMMSIAMTLLRNDRDLCRQRTPAPTDLRPGTVERTAQRTLAARIDSAQRRSAGHATLDA